MSANGQLAASELMEAQPGIYLATYAAIVYLAMKNAGMPGSIAEPIGGYRDLATQRALKANPGAYNSSLKPSQIAAAGSSSHGLGQNMDLVGGAAQWAIAWGKPFGVTQRDAKNDPNCFHVTAGVYVPPAQQLAGNERATAVVVNGRTSDDTAGRITAKVAPHTVLTVRGFTHGQVITQNGITSDLWYVSDYAGADRYYWAGGFTEQATHDLTDLDAPAQVNPAPVPVDTLPPVTPAPEPVTPAPDPEPATGPVPPAQPATPAAPGSVWAGVIAAIVKFFQSLGRSK